MSNNSQSLRKVLFVCLGNIIRSPAGEALLKKKVEEKGISDQFHIESRGCARSQVGKGRDPRMVEAAKKRDLHLKGHSTLVTSQDLAFFDEIYAADNAILERLLSMATGEEERKKIQLFTAHSKKYHQEDVPDPYYEGEDGFEIVLDILEEACSAILSKNS